MRDVSGEEKHAEGEEKRHTDDVVSLIPSLRAFARSLTRDRDQADDLVQETLVKAIAKRHLYQPGTNLRAWLFTIMRNTFYNSLKLRSREQTGASECVAGSVVTPSTQEWTLRGQEMVAATNRLPQHYRETLVLVVMLGESYEETARICGCEIGTVKSRVARARAMLVKDLEGSGS